MRGKHLLPSSIVALRPSGRGRWHILPSVAFRLSSISLQTQESECLLTNPPYFHVKKYILTRSCFNCDASDDEDILGSLEEYFE